MDVRRGAGKCVSVAALGAIGAVGACTVFSGIPDVGTTAPAPAGDAGPDGTDGSPPPDAAAEDAPAPCVLQISTGKDHACGRRADGTVWCWGRAAEGQLGDAAMGAVMKPAPVQVVGLDPGALEVSAGGWHTCARKADGTLWCWGWNLWGQLGDGTSGKWSFKSAPVAVSMLGAHVVGVSAASTGTCGLRKEGASSGATVWCWGDDSAAQASGKPLDGGGAAGGDSSSADAADEAEAGTPGTIEALPVPVSGLADAAVEVRLGEMHACARMSDGTLWCWGDNQLGQMGTGVEGGSRKPPTQVAALGAVVSRVDAGTWHTCVLRSETNPALTSTWCWGGNLSGQVGDGTGYPVGDIKPSPLKVVALGTDAAAVATGGDTTCALSGAAKAWCWGNNDKGQVGAGALESSVLWPKEVQGLGAPVAQIDPGESFTCALLVNGTVWCWGGNEYGQLGNGTSGPPTLAPVKVAFPGCP